MTSAPHTIERDEDTDCSPAEAVLIGTSLLTLLISITGSVLSFAG